jgi:hypothetical protein
MGQTLAKKQNRKVALMPTPDPIGLEGMLAIYEGWLHGAPRTTKVLELYCSLIAQHGYNECPPREVFLQLAAMSAEDAAQWLERTYYQHIPDTWDIVRILRGSKQEQSK